MQSTISEPELLSPADLAARYAVTTGHLRNLRSQRKGIPYLKLGGMVFYRVADVLAYEEAARVATEPLHVSKDAR